MTVIVDTNAMKCAGYRVTPRYFVEQLGIIYEEHAFDYHRDCDVFFDVDAWTVPKTLPSFITLHSARNKIEYDWMEAEARHIETFPLDSQASYNILVTYDGRATKLYINDVMYTMQMGGSWYRDDALASLACFVFELGAGIKLRDIVSADEYWWDAKYILNDEKKILSFIRDNGLCLDTVYQYYDLRMYTLRPMTTEEAKAHIKKVKRRKHMDLEDEYFKWLIRRLNDQTKNS
mgnify:CR=1 FL=1